MAEEFVRIVQFGEFVKRMEEGFVRVSELARSALRQHQSAVG